MRSLVLSHEKTAISEEADLHQTPDLPVPSSLTSSFPELEKNKFYCFLSSPVYGILLYLPKLRQTICPVKVSESPYSLVDNVFKFIHLINIKLNAYYVLSGIN